MPAAAAGAIPLLAAGWLFAVGPHLPHLIASIFQVIGLVCFVLAALDILGIVPAIFLYNFPRRFVPPHLRDQPGFLAEARVHDHRGSRKS